MKQFLVKGNRGWTVKFSFYEKTTKIEVIFLMDRTFPKYMKKISPIFVAFSEKLSFKKVLFEPSGNIFFRELEN